ncbi:nitroreductase family protein [Paenibacillus contaminans]|uniref:Nitroreductase n=1 Tax=Paenibacillus contaminans TaxID=450362 RepID=A0A329MTQ6_9BACL|nr:nitroreductase [Paenibacillus contaminans]RAV23281.1 nitroreductase [Paenibacillus contaminans]
MNTNHLFVAEAIRNRRTVKRFKLEPVPESLILELLDIAVWAPNHKLREPWRFALFVEEGKQVVVDAIIANAMKKRDPEQLMKIPAFLTVMIEEDSRQKELEEDMLAAGTLIQNFQLAAWERGIGVTWLTEPFTYQPGFRADVGVKPTEKLIGLLQIGYPETVPPAQPRTAAKHKLTIVRSS